MARPDYRVQTINSGVRVAHVGESSEQYVMIVNLDTSLNPAHTDPGWTLVAHAASVEAARNLVLPWLAEELPSNLPLLAIDSLLSNHTQLNLNGPLFDFTVITMDILNKTAVMQEDVVQ